MPTRSSTALGILAAVSLSACGMSTSGPATEAPSSSAQPTKPPLPITDAKAKPPTAFLADATAKAQKVAADAVLVAIDSQRGADFDAHVPADGSTPHWLYSFSSKAKGLDIFVAGSTLEVKVLTQTPGTYNADSILPKTFIDAPAAFAAAQKNGGADYAKAHPNTPVYFDLNIDPTLKKPVWVLSYSVNARTGTYSLVIDAVSGAFIAKRGKSADLPA